MRFCLIRFWQAKSALEQFVFAEKTASCHPSLIKFGTGRGFGYSQQFHAQSVEHPHSPAGMLDAQRAISHDLVQVVFREIPCRQLVIANRTNPAFVCSSLSRIVCRCTNTASQLPQIGNLADIHRPQRLCQ